MNTPDEFYKKVMGKNFNMVDFEPAFDEAVGFFPITRDMPPNAKRMQAAQRIKFLGEKKFFGNDFASDMLEFIYHVSDEELEEISF